MTSSNPSLCTLNPWSNSSLFSRSFAIETAHTSLSDLYIFSKNNVTSLTSGHILAFVTWSFKYLGGLLSHVGFVAKELVFIYNSEVVQIFCFLTKSTEVEESQQLETSAGTEVTGLFVDQEQQITRSSSTSDIADQFPSDFFQGNIDEI